MMWERLPAMIGEPFCVQKGQSPGMYAKPAMSMKDLFFTD